MTSCPDHLPSGNQKPSSARRNANQTANHVKGLEMASQHRNRELSPHREYEACARQRFRRAVAVE